MSTLSAVTRDWENAAGPPVRAERPSLMAFRALKRNRGAFVGFVVVLMYVGIGIVGWIAYRGPDIASIDYATQDLMTTFAPLGASDHILGTDHLGRDMFSRLIVGIGISLAVGFGITALSMLIGVVAGSIAGYHRGWADTVISGIVEVTWGFPLILIAVILSGALGPGLTATMLAVGLINWAGFARVVRGEVLSLREREFVQAAMATGVSDRRILVRHVLPNTLAPVMVM